MFAGGRYVFERALRVGDHMTRESRIVDVQSKIGRSGPLVFVVVRHEISTASGPALVEEHDIVYRDGSRSAPSTPAPRRAAETPAWSHEVRVDDVTLFRYSALTFNGHRIHYDRRYATEVEGYPGLVVHGPLVATLMLELLRRDITTAPVAEFSFRAMSPIFDVAPFFVCGRRSGERTVHLWATQADGALAMDATATLRTPPLT
jgi:3-methylfumaryl-CoA hydratase